LPLLLLLPPLLLLPVAAAAVAVGAAAPAAGVPSTVDLQLPHTIVLCYVQNGHPASSR
jgi:hypothetical protein